MIHTSLRKHPCHPTMVASRNLKQVSWAVLAVASHSSTFLGDPKERMGRSTLPETNVAPENRALEKEIPIGNHPFLGAMLVLGSVSLEVYFLKATSWYTHLKFNSKFTPEK